MNESLIGQLDQLHDNYAQRRKVAASLIAALKSSINAQNKTMRVFRDYVAQNNGVAAEKLEQARVAFAGSRLKEEAVDPLLPGLRREIKLLAALTNALQGTATALRSAPVDVLRLDHALGILESATQPDIVAIIPDLNHEFDVAQRALGDEFGQVLREALAEQGLSVSGRPPRFEIGRFEVEANFGKRFAALRYGKDLVVPRVPLTSEAVVRAYQAAVKAITGRSEDGVKWMAQFYDAYQFARRKREVAGARVNIVDCYVELSILRQGRAFTVEPSRHSFNDYTRAQFIYDFYEFANHRRVVVRGQRARVHDATKTHTDNPARSMWVVEGDGPYDGRYISDVEFEEE